MDWKEIKNGPEEDCGWFAVAIVPNNHSGTTHEDKTDLSGDNSWRESFGFTKAWFNGSRWWEPDPHGNRSKEITERVTHWGYLPAVPELKETFIYKP